jgi:hypothetical protein
MANHTYTAQVAKSPIIDAGAVDTVTLTGFAYATDANVEVFNHGTGTDIIWFTTNGTDPVPFGDDNYFARPGAGLTVNPRRTSGSNSVVKVYCAASVRYSVTGS